MAHRAIVSAFAISALWAPTGTVAQTTVRSSGASDWKPADAGTQFDLSENSILPQTRQDSRHRMGEGGTTVPDGVDAKEKLGPRWNYQPMENGPKLEFGALGAGRKDAPRLMHFSLDWDF